MPHLRIIIATACADADMLLACYRAGAVHHLIKPFTLESCRAAVRLYCDQRSGFVLRPALDDSDAGRVSFRSNLTVQESAILECMVAGMSYKIIHEHLGISQARLKHLQHRAFGKLGAHNQAQAARLWMELRLSTGCEVTGLGDGI